MQFAHLAPIVYLHSEEKFRPIPVDRFTYESDIVTEDGTYYTATAENLAELQSGPKPVRMTLQSSYDWTTPEATTIPPTCYVKAKPYSRDIVQVDFWFLFGFNPGYCRACPMKEGCCGAHQADWENVTLHVKMPSRESKDMEIDRVFFSSHGDTDGYWKLAKDCEYATYNDRKRLVVYSALNAHGFYHKPGKWWRIWCCANDHTDQGLLVVPEVLPGIGPWFNYSYPWGNWSVTTPEWETVGNTSNNTFRRLCCCIGDATNALTIGPLPGNQPYR